MGKDHSIHEGQLSPGEQLNPSNKGSVYSSKLSWPGLCQSFVRHSVGQVRPAKPPLKEPNKKFNIAARKHEFVFYREGLLSH